MSLSWEGGGGGGLYANRIYHCLRIVSGFVISMFALQVLVQCRINPIANNSIIRYAQKLPRSLSVHQKNKSTNSVP